MEKIWLHSYPKGVAKEIDESKLKILPQIFKDSVNEYGDKVAFENFNSTLTFNELDKLSDNFASFLTNYLGLKKNDRIAIQMPNLLQYPVVMLGALKAGLIVVNTNPLYTEKEMAHQFKDAGIKAVVIFEPFAHKLNNIKNEVKIESIITTKVGDLLGFPKSMVYNFVLNLKTKKEFKNKGKKVPVNKVKGSFDFHQAINLGSNKSFKAPDSKINDTAFLQYTGGTTGVAKGAELTHRNIAANMLQILEWKKPLLTRGEEIILTPLPLYHIFSLTVNCFAFLHFGGRNILITNPKDIPAFIKLMDAKKYTVLTGVNTLYNALMNHKDFEKLDFSKLKISVAGGMALQRAVCSRWEKITGLPIIEGYGLTETSPVACCNPIDGTNKLDHIGLPLPSTDCKIIDDNGQEVAMGERGEICIKGPQVMKGYWNRDDETKLVLGDDGWLKTGDIAIVDKDGFFKIVDRKKDMILVSGFNVYPNEVEDALANHPGILEVAAIGVPDEATGEKVKVFIVKKDSNLTADEVIAFAKTSLTGYKTPHLVEFRDELPKTNVGKILRKELREEELKKLK
jgi:long-chain acyl-CoA synthetase